MIVEPGGASSINQTIIMFHPIRLASRAICLLVGTISISQSGRPVRLDREKKHDQARNNEYTRTGEHRSIWCSARLKERRRTMI